MAEVPAYPRVRGAVREKDVKAMGEPVKVVDLPKSAWLRVREWAGEHGRYQRACLAEAVNEWADRQEKGAK